MKQEKMFHTIENLFIVCMDFRLPKVHVNWAEENLGNKNYDLVALAGAQEAVIDEDTRETVRCKVEANE